MSCRVLMLCRITTVTVGCHGEVKHAVVYHRSLWWVIHQPCAFRPWQISFGYLSPASRILLPLLTFRLVHVTPAVQLIHARLIHGSLLTSTHDSAPRRFSSNKVQCLAPLQLHHSILKRIRLVLILGLSTGCQIRRPAMSSAVTLRWSRRQQTTPFTSTFWWSLSTEPSITLRWKVYRGLTQGLPKYQQFIFVGGEKRQHVRKSIKRSLVETKVSWISKKYSRCAQNLKNSHTDGRKSWT